MKLRNVTHWLDSQHHGGAAKFQYDRKVLSLELSNLVWSYNESSYLGPLLLTWANPNSPMDISNCNHYMVWDEITYPFLNYSGAVKVWEWISNFISHFTGLAITYPCWSWIQALLIAFQVTGLLALCYSSKKQMRVMIPVNNCSLW